MMVAEPPVGTLIEVEVEWKISTELLRVVDVLVSEVLMSITVSVPVSVSTLNWLVDELNASAVAWASPPINPLLMIVAPFCRTDRLRLWVSDSRLI